MKDILGVSGAAATKAKLFDDEVHKEKKLSGARIVRILMDYAERVETAVKEARISADRIDESSRKLMGAKEVPLSELSLREEFPDVTTAEEGKDKTPKSKMIAQASKPANTPTIDLESTPDSDQADLVPKPMDGERNRNLTEIFEGMEAEPKSPTLGLGL